MQRSQRRSSGIVRLRAVMWTFANFAFVLKYVDLAAFANPTITATRTIGVCWRRIVIETVFATNSAFLAIFVCLHRKADVAFQNLDSLLIIGIQK